MNRILSGSGGGTNIQTSTVSREPKVCALALKPVSTASFYKWKVKAHVV